MKISVSTVAFPGAELAQLPKLAAKAGAEGIAISCSDQGPLRLDASDSELHEFRARCEDAGIAVSAVYGYAGRGILADEAATLAKDIDVATRCIDIAVQLNCRVSRLFAWKGRPSSDLIDRFVERAQPIAHHALTAGVSLGIPTHHDLAFDPESCRRLIEGFGRNSAAIIFNGQSMEMDGIDPVAALRKMSDIVSQSEIKDWRRDGDQIVPVVMGTGDATVFPIVEELLALNCGDWLTLHHLRQHHPELPPLDSGMSAAIRKTIREFNAKATHV